MYNLLLIDDEILIADGMYDALYEENMENLHVMKAYSVSEALQAAKTKRIDILLTDINMPDLDGFGLFEQVIALWPYCRVIFLTGYQSFDYAYKAIQYKDVRYLIKADGVDRVLETVKEVMGELDQQLQERIPENFDLEQESRERLIKEILIGYFNGEIEEENLYRDDLKALGFQIDIKRPLYLAGAKYNRTDLEETYEKRLGFVKDMNVMLRGHLKENIRIVPLDMNQGILWLLQPEDEQENLVYFMNVFDLFQVHLKRACDLDSIVVVCREAMIDEVKQQFHQLYGMLRTQMMIEGNLLTYEELQKIVRRRNWTGAEEPGIELIKQKIPRLNRALELLDRESFFQEAQPVFEALQKVKSRHSIWAKETYLSFSLCMLEFISQTGLYEKLPFTLSLTPLTNPEEFSDWEETVSYLKCLAEAIFRLKEEKNSDEMNLVIQKVERLVEENLEKELNIALLAERLYFNACYLSRIFKTVKGVTLSDYITERKMSRAKQLLTESDCKVQKIGERLGYSSPANFIRSFKKYYGVTPNEYRRMYYLVK